MFRLHEWAADRFSFVQYPNVIPLSNAASVRRSLFRHQIPWYKRLYLALMSLGLLVLALALLAAVCGVIWALIDGAISQ